MPKRKRYLDNGGKPDKKTVYKAKYTGKIYNTAREAAIDNTRYLREPINRFDAKSKEYPRYEELNIPFIEEKRRTLSNAGLATGAVISENLLDSIAKYADIEGLPLKTALGLVTKESTLGNPTDDKSVYKLLGEDKALFFKRGGGGQFINKGGQDVDARGLVNYYKDTWNPYEEAIKIAKIKATGSNGVFVKPVNWGNDDNPNYLEALDEYNKQKAIFDKTLIEGEKYADRQAEKKRSSIKGNVLQAAFRDYKNNPNGYNPGQRNYPQLVERRGNEVWNSPEIQNWYKHRDNKRNGGRISLRNGGRLQLRGGGKSSFVKSLETQPTILEQVAEYNKEPKVRRATKESYRQQRIREQKAANQRERNIAKHYLAAGPNIANLAKAAYHWYNSVPMLGGQPEDGNDYITGIADAPGMRNPKDILNGTSTLINGLTNNRLRNILNSYEKGLTQYKGAKLPNPLEYKFDTPKINIDFNNLTTDNFVDYLSKQTGRTIKRVPIRDTEHGELYKQGFSFVDDEGKELAYIAGRKEAGDNVWVGASYVAPEFRHQGLGKQMYFDFNDNVFNTYGTTLHSSPYQRVGSTGAGMSPSNRLWKSLRDNGMSFLEGNGLNRYDVMAEPSKIITAYRNQKASGGTIHIAPSKRGTFTAAATRHGMGVQEFANTVLRNKDRYSPSLVKKANFARNASKWNH